MRRTAVVVFLLATGIAQAQPTPGGAPAIELSSRQAAPGAEVAIEAHLQTGGASIGAVQADLGFDSVNTPVVGISVGVPDCTLNPELSKQFIAIFRPMGCIGSACNVLRAFVFPESFPITPIADGALLYTCRFVVQPTAPFAVYPLTLSGLVFGDLNGDPVADGTGVDGAISVVQPSPTPTQTATPTASATVTATPTPIPCVGDCNRDGEVTIDELIRAVSIALGSGDLVTCLPADSNGDGELTIDELIKAVNRALGSC
ncbi:MAG: hypothetical protein HY270_09825 [Deltaproteobacteria bacterium]|nr:hypothetical protein [Deltaproteobacteria bacterium]